MIGLDTNVLVRYLIGDDVRQAELARQLIEGQCLAANPARIALIVLCELVWVLGGAYRYDRELIVQALRQILVTEGFEIEQHSLAWTAWHDFARGTADYADCLIARVNEATGSSTTYTFDRKAARLAGFTLLDG